MVEKEYFMDDFKNPVQGSVSDFHQLSKVYVACDTVWMHILEIIANGTFNLSWLLSSPLYLPVIHTQPHTPGRQATKEQLEGHGVRS